MSLDAKEYKKIKDESRAETERYIGAINENFLGHISAIAEQYTSIQKTLDLHSEQFEVHREMLGSLKEDVEVLKDDMRGVKEDIGVLKEGVGILKDDMGVVKTDVEFIKGGLKKKVDYDEFQALEKRFTLSESKVNKKLKIA